MTSSLWSPSRSCRSTRDVKNQSSSPLSPSATLLAKDELLSPSVCSTGSRDHTLDNVTMDERTSHTGPFLHKGQILLPSRGPTNDVSRSRNVGNALNADRPNLARASTAPNLLGEGSAKNGKKRNLRKAATTDFDPRTPRSQRGLIRRASKVSMSYPEMPVYVDAKDLPRWNSACSSCKPPIPSHLVRRPSRPASAPGGKRVSFAEEVVDPKKRAKQRSARLLTCLFAMRRAGLHKDGAESLDPDSPTEQVRKKDTQEETLMYATIRDVSDDSEVLHQRQTSLEQVQEPVSDAGGACHASVAVAARTLAVVRRKLILVALVENRLAEFRSASSQNKELLAQLLSQEQRPPLLSKLLGIAEFLKAQVHKDGHPADADKGDFEAFSASFGLPAKHKLVLTLRRLAEEATDWWAIEALREAESGANADAIRRILAVVSGINGIHTHRAVQECNVILGDRLAKEVLALAEKLQRRDADTVARSSEAQPESAKQAAADINHELSQAVAHGAPPKHTCMEKAKCIATALTLEEKKRYALKALRYAQTLQARDAAAADKAADGVPEVGPASELADLIEREIKGAVHKGAAEEDPSLKDARDIARGLRDEDGQRKRLKARQRRLTAKENMD